MSAGKGVKRSKSSNIPGQGVMRTGKRTIRAGKLEEDRIFNVASFCN